MFFIIDSISEKGGKTCIELDKSKPVSADRLENIDDKDKDKDIRDRDFYDLEHFETLFADYETCRSRCMKDLEYCDKEDTFAPERLAQARMIRMMTDPEHEENTLNAQLNEAGELTDITALPDWSDGAFWQFCPSVPSPFRPGDFVYSIAGRTTDLPAVYLGKGSEISAADRFLPPNANPDRLYALTYDPEDGVSLFDERGCSPFELDLAPEPLKGADRMLYAIRAYVLGKIHLGDLFALDRIAKADARAEQARDRMRTVDLFALRDLVSPKKDDNP